MKKHILIIITFLSQITSAQVPNINEVTFKFYPAFEPSSTITFNLKKSDAKLKIDDEGKTNKFNISNGEKEILISGIDNLLNHAEPPFDTLFSSDGEITFVDRRLIEDGMTTYIYFNDNKEPSIELGSTYSRRQSEFLTKLTYIIKNRTNNIEYIDKIQQYLY
jgi:hypothetical protein